MALSGGGRVRILGQQACAAQTADPQGCMRSGSRLTLQNLTLVDGDACAGDLLGGGAVYVDGGRLKVVSCRFFRNACAYGYPGGGGGAIRAQLSPGGPAYVVGSTFGGRPGLGNIGINGGALSTDSATLTVLNSVLSHNRAMPAAVSAGGAISASGPADLSVCGSVLTDNSANGYGGALFFASQRAIRLERSIVRGNRSGVGSDLTDDTPGITTLGTVINDRSVVE